MGFFFRLEEDTLGLVIGSAFGSWICLFWDLAVLLLLDYCGGGTVLMILELAGFGDRRRCLKVSIALCVGACGMPGVFCWERGEMAPREGRR